MSTELKLQQRWTACVARLSKLGRNATLTAVLEDGPLEGIDYESLGREGESAAAQPGGGSQDDSSTFVNWADERAVPPAAETAEQDIQQVLDFYNNWHDHSEDFTPDRDTVGLVVAYAANVREVAQHNEANLREAVRRKQVKDSIIRELRRKLAEQDDQISALKELVERYLGKLAELEKALCKIGDTAVAALASLRAEP